MARMKASHVVELSFTPAELAKALGYDGAAVVRLRDSNEAINTPISGEIVIQLEYLLAAKGHRVKKEKIKKFETDFKDEHRSC